MAFTVYDRKQKFDECANGSLDFTANGVVAIELKPPSGSHVRLDAVDASTSFDTGGVSGASQNALIVQQAIYVLETKNTLDYLLQITALGQVWSTMEQSILGDHAKLKATKILHAQSESYQRFDVKTTTNFNLIIILNKPVITGYAAPPAFCGLYLRAIGEYVDNNAELREIKYIR